MSHPFRAIGLALLLAGLSVMPAAAQGTPSADSSAAREVEISDARILSLSPDGKLFVAGKPTDSRSSNQLCIFDVATLTEQACGDLENSHISIRLDTVVWSPDSAKVAFSEDAFRTFNDGDLWVMDAESGELTNVTDDGVEGGLPILGDDESPSNDPIYIDIRPAWAPDSRSIAFSRSPIIGGEFRGNQIVQLDLESGEVETLVPVTIEEPGVVYVGIAWAPDGSRLYYSVAHSDFDDATNGVWAYDRPTGQAQHILKSDPDKGSPAIMRVAATGQTGLIFYPIAAAQFDVENDIYALIDLESHALTPIHPNPSDPSSPARIWVVAFSPDGTRVLYGLNRIEDSRTRFLVREVPDGEPELVAEIDGPPVMTTIGGGLFWGADGTVFAATDVNAGLLLHVDPGVIPTVPAVEPVASPTAESAASPAATAAFVPGATVTLTAETTLRATPSSNGTVVLELRPDAVLTIVGEPVEAGGGTWVPVIEPATGTIGYVDATVLEME